MRWDGLGKAFSQKDTCPTKHHVIHAHHKKFVHKKKFCFILSNSSWTNTQWLQHHTFWFQQHTTMLFSNLQVREAFKIPWIQVLSNQQSVQTKVISIHRKHNFWQNWGLARHWVILLSGRHRTSGCLLPAFQKRLHVDPVSNQQMHHQVRHSSEVFLALRTLVRFFTSVFPLVHSEPSWTLKWLSTTRALEVSPVHCQPMRHGLGVSQEGDAARSALHFWALVSSQAPTMAVLLEAKSALGIVTWHAIHFRRNMCTTVVLQQGFLVHVLPPTHITHVFFWLAFLATGFNPWAVVPSQRTFVKVFSFANVALKFLVRFLLFVICLCIFVQINVSVQVLFPVGTPTTMMRQGPFGFVSPSTHVTLEPLNRLGLPWCFFGLRWFFHVFSARQILLVNSVGWLVAFFRTWIRTLSNLNKPAGHTWCSWSFLLQLQMRHHVEKLHRNRQQLKVGCFGTRILLSNMYGLRIAGFLSANFKFSVFPFSNLFCKDKMFCHGQLQGQLWQPILTRSLVLDELVLKWLTNDTCFVYCSLLIVSIQVEMSTVEKIEKCQGGRNNGTWQVNSGNDNNNNDDELHQTKRVRWHQDWKRRLPFEIWSRRRGEEQNETLSLSNLFNFYSANDAFLQRQTKNWQLKHRTEHDTSYEKWTNRCFFKRFILLNLLSHL